MKTCKTCKTCNNWKRDVKMGACSSPKFVLGYHITMDEMRPDEVLVENYEGWGFVTGPNFGCIHHEKK